jgi:AbiV family abortive infection protein
MVRVPVSVSLAWVWMTGTDWKKSSARCISASDIRRIGRGLLIVLERPRRLLNGMLVARSMKKDEGLSKYKFKRLAVESLRNAIRLHFDSLFLFEIGSYPSAFQLSVLALEEFSKAKWLEHYIYSSETNSGYPDADFEQKWLKLLYSHPEKQWAFIARDLTDFSPKFSESIEDRKLEERKQNATYVGLPRVKGSVDVNGRISIPTKTSSKDAKQLISFINAEFLTICWRIHDDDFYFAVSGMDDVFDDPIFKRLLSWPHKSRIRSRTWYKHWRKKWGY